MKIFVFMGGSSSEKNISIKTGNAIVASLSGRYEVKPLNISFHNNDISFLEELQKGDVVFNALHGGSGENGDIQSVLDMKGISYTGSGSKLSKSTPALLAAIGKRLVEVMPGREFISKK